MYKSAIILSASTASSLALVPSSSSVFILSVCIAWYTFHELSFPKFRLLASLQHRHLLVDSLYVKSPSPGKQASSESVQVAQSSISTLNSNSLKFLHFFSELTSVIVISASVLRGSQYSHYTFRSFVKHQIVSP